jgi:polysaccharide deacetylase 2 family uncharacterized protein YibQ
MSKKRRKNRTKEILITATIGVLITTALVVTAVLLHIQKTPVTKETPERTPMPQSIPQGVPQRIIQGEQLLIKGCLFDMGIAKENVRITGSTIDVTLAKEIKESRIREAFASLDDVEGVAVSITEASRIIVIINAHEWEIIFRVRAPDKKPARVAIIIDDMGLDMDIARQLCTIDADLTFSGKEVLLHMPMEGNGKDPGQGAIFRDMDPLQAEALLREALKAVPYIVGVNNHMGSEVTQNEAIMMALLTTIKQNHLFYIDSLTTNNSICGEVASVVNVPFEARDVFLDNEQTYPYISGQFDELISVAKRHGKAIAICHPNPITVETLAREIPRLKARGIVVQRVSELVAKHR